MSETDLARLALRQLEEMGFDCYQEVAHGAHRADIVGVRRGIVCIVECKTALSFDVVAQADDWLPVAHWRFIAVPMARYAGRGRELAYAICEQRGIGVLEISEQHDRVWILRYPALNRAAKPQRLLDALRPEHKTYAAAGSSGSYWSPWKSSVQSLVLEVNRKPGRPLRDVIAHIKHHWVSNKSAVSCVSRQIADGAIEGLRLEKKGRAVLVFPTAK